MVCSLLPFGYIKNKRITIFLITIFTLALLALLMLEQYDIIVFQTKLGERVFSIFRAKENLERIYTWQNSLDIITDYPLTGIGKEIFQKLLTPIGFPMAILNLPAALMRIIICFKSPLKEESSHSPVFFGCGS